MSYASFEYLGVFLTVSLLVYALIPQKRRWLVLLSASCFFYVLNSWRLSVFLLAAVLISWSAALGIERAGAAEETPKAVCRRRRRAVLAAAVAADLAILVFLKYYNFLGGAGDSLLGLAGLPPLFPQLDWLKLPLGISFYTLEAVSYLADVYLERCPAERNPAKLALFLLFFPTVVEGPVARWGSASETLFAGRMPDFRGCAFAAQRICWGMMKKLIIADRADILVNEIFNHHSQYSGLTVAFGAVLYTVQIYADFSGMIDVSLGSAELFGVRLPENFRQPFFSRTVTEFWRRWHITLGAWLRDYVFFPLSLSHRSMKLRKWGKRRLNPYYATLLPTARAMFFVWLAIGVWHGSGWKYIAYGLYYFVISLAGLLLEPLSARLCRLLRIDRTSRPYRAFQLARTLVFVCCGMMLFRADSLPVFWQMLRSVFAGGGAAPLLDGSLFTHGFDRHDLLATAAGTLAMLLADVLQERGVHLRTGIAAKPLPLRWGVYLALLLGLVIFGAYGGAYTATDPIYAGF